MHAFRYLNGQVIVFRDQIGEASVLSAYCRHLGVGLTEGSVVDGTIRCPYRHWQYGKTGSASRRQ
ncbi:Rieske 2Fe-2S domain-containing protein [Marinobacter salarius]|uniref:Rieske 2Fe-2S domain-containing protein n=1 Tax=Marinobacter salarius TaxID=1420917 RepID=UPI0032F02C36